MIKLLLVRHGETEWNRIGRYQGQSDTELSPTGQQQAERLAKRLRSEPIHTIYCSDLKRAIQTAEPIASVHSLLVNRCKELREIDFGEFEGKYFEEIERIYMPLEREWRAGNLSTPVPGGESLAQMGDRVIKFVADLRSHHDDGTILVVGHGGPLQMMICHLLDVDLGHWWRFHLDSASVSMLYVYPEATILSLMNCTYHLKDTEG